MQKFCEENDEWRVTVYNSVIIGAGFAGAVVARKLAEKNKKVLVIEKREHIGGNCYDELDENGILIHKYGPHIFHTNDEEVFEFLSKYTEWYNYSHEVVGYVHGQYIPIPFNLNTLELVYGKEKAESLKDMLIETYGFDTKVPILELQKSASKEIREIADYVYENVFLRYTMKQWGQKPEEVDASVTARVPVVLSYDNRYFQDKFQGMPLDGYTKLFENLLNHENIEVRLGVDAKDILTMEEGKPIYFEGEEFNGDVIYTGPLDELFGCKYGRLPYRSLEFKFEHFNKDYVLPKGVVNYTVSEDYTRITEYKYLTGQKKDGSTTIMKEYPMKYEAKEGQIPYYAIMNETNQALYEKYLALVKGHENFHVLGRLAEYKYYNIDAIVGKALALGRTL